MATKYEQWYGGNLEVWGSMKESLCLNLIPPKQITAQSCLTGVRSWSIYLPPLLPCWLRAVPGGIKSPASGLSHAWDKAPQAGIGKKTLSCTKSVCRWPQRGRRYVYRQWLSQVPNLVREAMQNGTSYLPLNAAICQHETICKTGWLNAIKCPSNLTFDLLAHPQGWPRLNQNPIVRPGFEARSKYTPFQKPPQAPASHERPGNQQPVSNFAWASCGACFCPRWHTECSPPNYFWVLLAAALPPPPPSPLPLADLCYKIRGSGLCLSDNWRMSNGADAESYKSRELYMAICSLEPSRISTPHHSVPYGVICF